jgi:hypothetical protein
MGSDLSKSLFLLKTCSNSVDFEALNRQFAPEKAALELRKLDRVAPWLHNTVHFIGENCA